MSSLGRHDVRFDENGWVISPVAALPSERSVSLFTAESSPRLDAPALARAAATLGVRVSMTPAKRYPAGGSPLADVATLGIEGGAGLSGTVELLVLPAGRARSLRDEALAAARSLGGAGMDAVVARARTVAQLYDPVPGERVALVAAAILSAAWLAAVLRGPATPVVGPKTIREILGV